MGMKNKNLYFIHELAMNAFQSILKIEGQCFGQLNRSFLGMSDGVDGVQWNIAISRDTNEAYVGINLEGKAYDNWPISKFILSELKEPTIEKIKSICAGDIIIRFTRDAWQITSRPAIDEEFIGGKKHILSECDTESWKCILIEALKCLNKERNYLGRATQVVTLKRKPKNGEQIREMQVSPHLTICSALYLEGDVTGNIQKAIEELQPVHDWVSKLVK